ncbi:MAG: hypothetical protein ACXVGH_13910, partial [Mycobacteriales bacterium]
LPKGTVIPGPGQVANQFESDADVSRALSLLRGGGSDVVLGNLLTLPVGNGLLYIEPVYTQSKKDPKYPILTSVIVSFGSQIAYQPSLAQALDVLFGAGAGTKVTPPSSPTSPTSPPPVGSTVAQLIHDAQKAYSDGQAALKAGDFAAYGQAQAALKTALDALAKAQGVASASASPTPAK